jgi:hypothetical protein
MNISASAGIATMLLAVISPAWTADSLTIERLATCQDSWVEWKSGDPARLQQFVDGFETDFSPDRFGAFVPRTSLAIMGLPVARVFPESIGMGVGFSVMVDASFDDTRKRLEQATGKPFDHCEPPSDGMRVCGREISEKKTLLMMTPVDAKPVQTLFGCFYFYLK